MLEVYAIRLPIIRAVARRFGYAIGLHGSGQRDLDLIAAPWVETAHTAEELVEAVSLAVQGVVVDFPGMEKNPSRRPHGRLAWSIQIGAGRYIDLSVMPLRYMDLDDYVFGMCPVCERVYRRNDGCEWCYAMGEAQTLAATAPAPDAKE
jgi:hypothetical protein